MTSNGTSQVTAFYSNRNVFITGATGFIGKMTIQKLIRTCPDIGGIYMLIRKKKNTPPEKRLEELFSDPIFDEMKKVRPNFMEKMHSIIGDICYEDLALYPADRKFLIEKIDIVIHSAAFLNMLGKIKVCVNVNVRGTRSVLKMCEEMKNLKAMLYVSTAFSNSNLRFINEYFYDPPIEPDTLINLVNEVKEDILTEITPKLLGDQANVYTYSKAVAEALIKSKMNDLPVGVFRPSVVLPTHKDPISGWTSNVNGPLAGWIAVRLGIMHLSKVDVRIRQDQIPAEYTVNHLICTIPDVAKQFREKSQRKNIVYNSVVTLAKSCSMARSQYLSYKYHTIPFAKTVYAIFDINTHNRVLFNILHVFVHCIPALFVDVFCLLTRRKPRLLTLYKKINIYFDACYYFNTKEIDFANDNMVRQWNELNEEDKQLFHFNMDDMDWVDYFKTLSLGLKKYVLKDKMDEESLQAACDKYQRLLWIHRIIIALLCTGCAYFLWIMFNKYCYD